MQIYPWLEDPRPIAVGDPSEREDVTPVVERLVEEIQEDAAQRERDAATRKRLFDLD